MGVFLPILLFGVVEFQTITHKLKVKNKLIKEKVMKNTEIFFIQVI